MHSAGPADNHRTAGKATGMVLPINDGKPKFKHLPAEMGGSGIALAA